jgi:hypothetical protein
MHISDYGLCSLIDVHMLDTHVLIATVTEAAIRLELRSERPKKPSSSGRKSTSATFSSSGRT